LGVAFLFSAIEIKRSLGETSNFEFLIINIIYLRRRQSLRPLSAVNPTRRFIEMGLRSVVFVLALAVCFTLQAGCQGPKNTEKEQPLIDESLSGEGIISDVKTAFQKESIFTIREDTGMSPGVPEEGVRTEPVVIIALGTVPVAGSWNLSLWDTSTRYLHLNLIQSDDAVVGGGELTDERGAVQVYAGGTVMGDGLALYVIPAGASSLYRLALRIIPGSMKGSYVYSGQGFAVPGLASGSMAPTTGTFPQPV
jgi:hypothetical protein